jgi:hypothetical protein
MWIDTTKLIAAFCNFANAPKMYEKLNVQYRKQGNGHGRGKVLAKL